MNITAINPLFQRLSPAFVATSLVIGALFVFQNFQLSSRCSSQSGPEKSAHAVSLPAWPRIDTQSIVFDGQIFKKQAGEQLAVNLGPLARRFRLAGTFFAASSYQQSRKAIIDDIQKKNQCLVAEGDKLDQNITVVSIFRDRVVLREVTPGLAESRDEQLWLSFTGGDKPVPPANSQEAAVTQGEADTALGRFGKRTGERRWVLQRKEVLRYYQELLNNPERLAKVFESLKPVYQTGKIAGYTLDVEGEGDVFRAFGLKQGDVIRQVNSMPMISQSRAEYFINEFVKDRVNGFVIDIERETKPEKMIYLIR
ncbi:MAG: hypothetical protein PHW60_04215 [Kiritimatiellae bacterium]|nr:hypothetical protein [Kiritimatiellia bacterium]